MSAQDMYGPEDAAEMLSSLEEALQKQAAYQKAAHDAVIDGEDNKAFQARVDNLPIDERAEAYVDRSFRIADQIGYGKEFRAAITREYALASAKEFILAEEAEKKVHEYTSVQDEEDEYTAVKGSGYALTHFGGAPRNIDDIRARFGSECSITLPFEHAVSLLKALGTLDIDLRDGSQFGEDISRIYRGLTESVCGPDMLLSPKGEVYERLDGHRLGEYLGTL